MSDWIFTQDLNGYTYQLDTKLRPDRCVVLRSQLGNKILLGNSDTMFAEYIYLDILTPLTNIFMIAYSIWGNNHAIFNMIHMFDCSIDMQYNSVL